MHSTIFTNKFSFIFFHYISKIILKLIGWKVIGEKPRNINKCVFVAAPHTSNWDFPMMLLYAFYFNIPVYWFGKKEIFPFPFSTFMKWLGGLPVHRQKQTNLVDRMSEIISESDKAFVVIPVEGTRKKVTQWKTGFYHIAMQANVPIVLSFLDFAKKEGGILSVFQPTGNIEHDLPNIKEKYAGISGKNKNSFSID